MEAIYDIDVPIKSRKTIKDILTPIESIKACKSSKLHKLKPRNNKVDRTRSKENRMKSICKKNSHASDN